MGLEKVAYNKAIKILFICQFHGVRPLIKHKATCLVLALVACVVFWILFASLQ